jgi:hypothetical protein
LGAGAPHGLPVCLWIRGCCVGDRPSPVAPVVWYARAPQSRDLDLGLDILGCWLFLRDLFHGQGDLGLRVRTRADLRLGVGYTSIR